eukprot:s4486_g4.t2
MHNDYRDASAAADQGEGLDPGPLEANQFSSAAAASTSSSETAATAQQGDPQPSQPEPPLPLLPQKRPADALFTTGAYRFFFDDFGEGVLEETPTTDPLPVPFRREAYYQAYLTSKSRGREMEQAGVYEEPDRPDASSDDEALPSSNARGLTHQELKQLDREIPWSEVMKLPSQSIEKYMDAVRDEQDNWMRWGGVRPLAHHEAKEVFKDERLRRRILRSRAAYRDKNKGLGEIKAKCRVGERNHEERAGPLYMYPPKDPLMLATGAFSAELYEVHKRLVEKGFTQHGFDKCLYYYVDPTGRLLALMIVHVDDLCTFHQDFDQDILRDMFVWGSVTIVEPERPGTFRGKEIRMMNRGKRVYYTVTQEAFIDGMDTGSLPKGRAKLGEKLTPDEWREFRSISGVARRQPLLSNRGAETSYTDLRRLYETVDYLKATRSNGLVYQDIPVSMASLLVTYTDSSWANAGLKSQFGVFVLLAPPQASEVKTKATVLDWKSGRSTRVCRSTLAAEASAADEGADRAAANMCLSELLYNEPAYKVGCKLNGKHGVDAKSLYDCIVSENPNVNDKRSPVNIRSVQQTVTPKDIHWVPTNIMHADGLTKLDSNLLLTIVKRTWARKLAMFQMAERQRRHFTWQAKQTHWQVQSPSSALLPRQLAEMPTGSTPSTDSIVSFVSFRISLRTEAMCWEPGRLFYSHIPRGLDVRINEMLQPIFSHINREDHAERTALLHLTRAFLKRSGWEASDDCAGWLKLYISHFPCISCVAVICQFVRFFPAIRLELDFDNMWKTRFEPADQRGAERFLAEGGLAGRRQRIEQGFYEW